MFISFSLQSSEISLVLISLNGEKKWLPVTTEEKKQESVDIL